MLGFDGFRNVSVLKHFYLGRARKRKHSVPALTFVVVPSFAVIFDNF